VSNMVSTAANEIVKAVTPRKPIKAIEEAEMEEEEEEEELNNDELPEVAEEPKSADAEPSTEEQSPVTELEITKPWDLTILAIGPVLLIYVFIIAVTIIPQESLPEQLHQLKTNLSSNLRFIIELMHEQVQKVFPKEQ